MSAEDAETLLTHVRELQIRLLVTAVVLVGAGVVAYLNYAEILNILRAPLNAPLYYNSVSGSFAFVMKICMVAGIAVSVPLIVYNFIMFVRPAFIEVFTRKRVFMMTLGSVLAAVGGAVFGFCFIIPGALHFFSGFQVNGLNELISADSYLNFVINVLITFVLMFQLPIIVSLIDRLAPISPKAMIKGEKWALIGSVLISLVVPFAMDFTTQILIATPIFVLYNISLLVVVFQHSYSRKVAKNTAKLEAKISRKAERTVARPIGRRVATPMPVVVATPLAPHPQLAEVMALQARTKHVVNAKALHANAKPAGRPILHPAVQVAKPIHKPMNMVVAAPQPALRPITQQHIVRSVDGMTRTISRSQPANVIRQAGTIRTPQRSVPHRSQVRSMEFVSGIR